MDFLPEYAKHCYQALLGIYEEAIQELSKEGRAFCVINAKNEVTHRILLLVLSLVYLQRFLTFIYFYVDHSR